MKTECKSMTSFDTFRYSVHISMHFAIVRAKKISVAINIKLKGVKDAIS